MAFSIVYYLDRRETSLILPLYEMSHMVCEISYVHWCVGCLIPVWDVLCGVWDVSCIMWDAWYVV